MPLPEPDLERYPELKKWVIGCLSGHKKPNDITFQLCARTGWDWSQSRQFVEAVAKDSRKEVHQRRMPFLLVMCLSFIAIGLYFTLSGILELKSNLEELAGPMNFALFMTKIFPAIVSMIYGQWGALLPLKLIGGMATFVGSSVAAYRAVFSALTGEGEDLVKAASAKPR